ncbi:hypothetical protein [Ralstonia insidiosa]|jgi:hypothetical protein|nr:hypothetical protein [Ralstonia insidiosa]MBA9940558.1 hypothetical protein [Ralstonia insidiosa]MBC9968990.1 hypothetical protein [Ralstonia insidiosa]MBX3905073.1 hypothetical protein [Ralstonia insidiosa]
MPQTNALTQLFSQEPCRGLIAANYTTVWLEARADGSNVRARAASTKRVKKVTAVTGPARRQLIALTQQVLAGNKAVDVTVNGQESMITRLQVVGGSDYAITSRSRVVGNRAFSSVVDAAVPV